jgi:hypothetical protein
MQRQQDTERPNLSTRRPRRSVGELIVAWLLILWGAGCAWVTGPYALEVIRRGPGEFPRYVALSTVLAFLQALVCFVAGLTILPRVRTLAKWLLFAAGLCWIGLVYSNFVLDPVRMVNPWELLWPSVFLMAALLLFFLGWWLGRQEDSEA